MKIGVVSDTHSHHLPQQMLDDFKDVDLILHAGDICSLKVLDVFQKIKEVKAVFGNMDESEIRSALPRRQIIKIEGFMIGLFHGQGPPRRLIERIKEEFKNEKVDAIVFGHSHNPLNKMIDQVLYFNPGSPNDTIFAPYRSYGILETNDKLTGKIIKLKKT